MTERWCPVAGYEGLYEVSDAGSVRALRRTVRFADGRVREFPARMCNTKASAGGYPLVLLSAGMARKRWAPVHRVVLAAFVGPCPTGQEGCHNNGVRSDARLENLRYDTRMGNAADRRKHGTLLAGANHPSTQYSDVTIEAVRRAKGTGTISVLASRFGLSRTHVWNIQNDKRRQCHR